MVPGKRVSILRMNSLQHFWLTKTESLRKGLVITEIISNSNIYDLANLIKSDIIKHSENKKLLTKLSKLILHFDIFLFPVYTLTSQFFSSKKMQWNCITNCRGHSDVRRKFLSRSNPLTHRLLLFYTNNQELIISRKTFHRLLGFMSKTESMYCSWSRYSKCIC